MIPLRDAHWTGVMRGLTVLKPAIREHERDLQLLIDTIPALAWSARPDGRAQFFSQCYLDYIGFALDDAADQGWFAAVHPDDIVDLAAAWEQILASGVSGEAEARLRRHDGEYRWFLFRASPLRDDQERIVKWYGVNTDIEDHKRAEEELRRSEAFLRQGQRLTLTGSLWWEVSTGTIVWSDETYRLMDVPRTMMPTLDLALSRVHPDDLPLVRPLIGDSATAGSNVDVEHRLLMPDGSVKHVHLVLHNIGHISKPAFVGAITDITERKRAEAELRTVQEALNRAGAELANVSRVTTLSALTASIAHEVNQPLAGIITNAGTCLRMLDAAAADIDGARETAKRTIRDGNRAADVIARLRALFCRRESIVDPVDLNDAAREVLALSAGDLQRNRVIVEPEFERDLPLVSGDRIQLQQVVLNLIRNASDAMADVHDRPRRLRIRTEREAGDRVRLTILDTGIGVPAEGCNSLFEAFYTTKRGGMGIGLFVSRSIIERHEGRLWAESNDGHGAAFSFSIPHTSLTA